MSAIPIPRGRPCVLLVEDDDDARTTLANWLTHEYDVVTARNGIEGLELATTRSPAPDVIIADVWMPRLDGVSMVKCMKQTELLRHVPVIFLTGRTSPRNVIAGIEAGARAYLAKPIDLNVLDSKLRSALSFKHS